MIVLPCLFPSELFVEGTTCDTSDVSEAECGMFLKVMAKTAVENPKLLAGSQSISSSVCLFYVVQWRSLLMTATL